MLLKSESTYLHASTIIRIPVITVTMMITKCLVALLVVLSFIDSNSVLGTFSYSITPARATLCPVEGVPCLTLSEFADELDTLYNENFTSFSSDIELIFEPGNYNLNKELAVVNISSFTILVANSVSSLEGLEEVTIICDMSAKFTIQAVDQVHINGIEFVDCAANVIALVDELILEDCSFAGRGSLAVKWTTNVTVFQSSFSSNITSDNGTGIVAGFYVYFSENVLIQSSRFHESITVSESSERLSVRFENSTVTMLDTMFISNIAYGHYVNTVIVFLVYSNVTGENCTFENNTVYHSDRYGGAIILSYESNLVISNCIFLENNSSHFGAGGAVAVVNSTMLVNNSFFHSNYAGGHGGAVYASYYSIVTVNNSRFLNNSALNFGGAISCTDVTVITMENTTFINNRARQYYGGAVYVRNGAVNVHRSTFISNTADKSGGAILSLNCTFTEVVDSTFYKNSAHKGGALTVFNGDLITTGSRYISNSAQSGGALIIYNSLTGTIHNAIFVNNSAKAAIQSEDNVYRAGGGALFIGLSNVSINQSVFNNNSTSLSHHRSEDFHQVEPVSQFNVVVSGGAIWSMQSDTTMSNTVFQHNNAYVDLSKNSLFSESVNTACYGGAVRFHYGHVNVHNSSFLKNKAYCSFGKKLNFNISYTENDGDPISTWNSTESDMVNITSYNQQPSINHVPISSGGALHIVYISSAEITNSDFKDNTAIEGGAVTIVPSNHTMGGPAYEMVEIYTENSEAFPTGLVQIENCTFRNNGATATAGGALSVRNASIIVHNCTFFGNKAGGVTLGLINGTLSNYRLHGTVNFTLNNFVGAGAIYFSGSTCDLYACSFTNNTDTAVIWFQSSATMSNIIFENNTGILVGVAIIFNSNVEIINSQLIKNKCSNNFDYITGHGAVLVMNDSVLVVNNTMFTDNTANRKSGIGGAICALFSTIVINDSVFSNCLAGKGDAIYSLQSSVKITSSKFYNNVSSTDSEYGGDVFIADGSVLLQNCIFSSKRRGGVITIVSVSLVSQGFLVIQNSTDKYACFFCVTKSTVFFYGNTILSNNGGSLVVFTSNVTFAGHTNITNNTLDSNGGIAAYRSKIVFTNQTYLMNNSGRNIFGGALFTFETKIYMYGHISISYNTASYGGGIYMHQSELYVFGKAEIVGNRAIVKGGGIYVGSSIIRLMKGSLYLRQNNAVEKGGGMYLNTHSKVYVVKTILECDNRPIDCFGSFCTCNDNSETWLMLKFIENHAHLGGAVYVTDDTNSDTCAANTSSPSFCFFQSYAVYYGFNLVQEVDPAVQIHSLNTYFVNNSASRAGRTIFGGLLDRCYVQSLSESYATTVYKCCSPPISALSYLNNVTNLQEENIRSEISSDPVRVCFCRDNEPDCSYHPQALLIRKGEQFTVSIVAVDQVNNTIPNTTIYSSVSPLAGLKEGQAIQDTGENCTNLTYNVVSPYDSERLSLYAEGPCKNIGMSVTSIGLTFTQCPVGFIMSLKSCNCDPHIYPEYVQTCLIDTESVLRRDNTWVSYQSYDNTTGQHTFLTHLHCPFDYCQPPNEEVWINFNIFKGEDVQCAFNRSGILCGACKEGLSLALGSSHCLPCSNNWLALVIPFALAGIALVAFLLVCNMTVAEGTLNGLIFYANIIATNQAILTPIDDSNVLSVFVAWLNLDIGIETCFFHGMDGYAKVWLQLAFPLYVIFLVILVIVICEHSKRITRLLSRKNPVTTLATLILLSYTKFLTVIIAAFSFTTLEFHDGNTRSLRAVWLMDANIEYFEWKHTLLFITALVILIVGIVYTLVLFSLQWLMKISNRFIFKWVNSPRLLPLMESYHGPYNLKHRYWTGLLLIIRVLLYLVYALNIQGDPSVNLLTILCACVMLLAFSNLAGKIYKNRLINVIEISVFFNLTLLSAGMLYIQATKRHRFQPVLARVSIAVAFLTFLLVLCYHMYKFVLAKYLKKLRDTLVQIKTKNWSYHSIDGHRQQPDTSTEFELETFNEGDGYSVTEINGLPPIDDNDTAVTIESTTLDGEEELCDSDHEEDDEITILV